MTDEKTCPKCHARLPADAPAGMCPRCLMEKGLETTAGHDAPHARLPQPGETFGPYHIGPRLGSGGMGAVYAATHIPSGRRLALKVLNHQLESTAHRQRFLREGRLAASVNHPNSVYIFGTEEIAGTPVIAMELAGGGTLQDRVKREGPMPVSEAVDAVLQIVEGLEAAESAGVLHRDVKPSNCFLEPDGTVKVGDFGLSISTTPRAETNLTHSGIFLGTPAFSSPEQLRGDELDARSDIYSVGVTLFYLLTGRTPFEARQLVALLATVLERPAPSPADFRPGVPAGLATVVQRCLEKQRNQRFSGYAEFRQALLPYASTAPTPATLGFRVLAFSVDLLVVALLAALTSIFYHAERRVLREHPEVGVLVGYLDYRRSLAEHDARRAAIEIIIADRFRDLVTNSNVWSQPVIDGVLTNVGDRHIVESFLRAHPKPTAEQIADAEKRLAPFRAELAFWTAVNQEFYSLSPGVFFLLVCLALLVLMVVIPGLLSLLLTGNSLLLRSLDIAIVTKNGAAASRLRVLWRQFLLWLLVALALGALIAAAALGRGLAAAVLLAGAVGETLTADRGIHERIAGTWFVPR